MTRRGERGSILAQVLMTTMVSAMLCSAILRARLQPALTVARSVGRVQDDLAAEGAVNRVTEVWTRGGICTSDGDRGVRCAGTGCDCACTLDPAERGAEETAVTSSPSPFGAACVLTASRQ